MELFTIFANAARVVRRNPALAVLPLLLDAASAAAGWWIAGFRGEPGLSIRIVLEMGLPSVAHVLNRPLPAHDPAFAAAAGSGLGWAAFVLLTLVYAFAQGGYIGLLNRCAGGGQGTAAAFFRESRRAWPRFAVYRAAILAAKPALSLLLAAMFGISGMFMALLALIAFRVVYLYLEFAMVVEGLDFLRALKPAREAMRAAARPTLAAAAILFVAAGAFSAAVHLWWKPVVYVPAALVYAFGMAVLQAAFIQLYRAARR